jgi:starch synthase
MMTTDPGILSESTKEEEEGNRIVRTAPLHVALVSPEITPFAKTGGLGDVLGTLPKALKQLGVRVSLFMPAYRSVLKGDFKLENTGVRFTVPVSARREMGSLWKAETVDGIPVYLIRADRYFEREYLYSTPEGDYSDNAERFVFFNRAVLEILKSDPPDILHTNDWQSALAIAFLKAQPELYPELSSVKTVFTVHNLGYQGHFLQSDWHLLNLDGRFFTYHFIEFYRKINFLKAGLVFADAITTVSPTYAEEIKTAEQGFGLEGVFQERADKLFGIINGVDYDIWNPETDLHIARKFNLKNLAGKRVCKDEIQQIFNLPQNPDIPLVGMVTRLSAQKGVDLLREAVDELFSRNLQFVLLGTGDRFNQDFFSRLPAWYPEKAGVQIAFDESMAHKVIAGCDLLFMPSYYEPGGLTQLYALRYGTIPIVRVTGGLKDTIEEFDLKTGKGNGFVFGPFKVTNLLSSVDRALSIFQHKSEWRTLVRNAIVADFSWTRSAQEYLNLYKELVKG